jgi:hypothetical protein
LGWLVFGWSKEKDAQITLANGIEYRKGQVQSTLPFLYHDHELSTAVLHTALQKQLQSLQGAMNTVSSRINLAREI